MDESLQSIISPANSPLIVLPSKFSFDQVAGALALNISLIMNEKDTAVYCPTPMTVGVNRLVGVQRIKNEVGNKNLAITFKGYDAGSIEKVSYDIVEGEFKLTIVPKTGLTAPSADMITTSFSGVSADLVILVGGATDEDFPILATPELSNLKIVHIGNRPFNSEKSVISLATTGSCVSEVTAKLIQSNSLPMDPDIATNLVMGIEAGSSNFSSNETTPDTFEVFAYLLRQGGVRRPKIVENFPAGSVPQAPTQTPQPVAETEAVDQNNTSEHGEVVENPPADWLTQPKVYKGTSTV